MASCQEPLLKSDEEEELVFDRTGLLSNQIMVKPDIRQRGHSSGRRLQFARTVNLCLAFFALGLCFAIPTATLKDLQAAVGADLSDIEFIYTARYSGYVFGSLIGGILFDRYNRQFLLFLSLLATAIGIIIMPFCTKLGALMTCTAITGVTMGFLDTGGNVWCLDLWGKKSAPFMQALHFCFGLGAFVSPLVAEPFLSPQFSNTTLSTGHLGSNSTVLNYPHVRFPHQRYVSSRQEIPNILSRYANDSELEKNIPAIFPFHKLPKQIYETNNRFSIKHLVKRFLEGTDRNQTMYIDKNITDFSNETDNRTENLNISEYLNISQSLPFYFNSTSSQEKNIEMSLTTVSTFTIITPTNFRKKPKKPHYADGNQLEHKDIWSRTSLKSKIQNLNNDNEENQLLDSATSTTVEQIDLSTKSIFILNNETAFINNITDVLNNSKSEFHVENNTLGETIYFNNSTLNNENDRLVTLTGNKITENSTNNFSLLSVVNNTNLSLIMTTLVEKDFGIKLNNFTTANSLTRERIDSNEIEIKRMTVAVDLKETKFSTDIDESMENNFPITENITLPNNNFKEPKEIDEQPTNANLMTDSYNYISKYNKQSNDKYLSSENKYRSFDSFQKKKIDSEKLTNRTNAFISENSTRDANSTKRYSNLDFLSNLFESMRQRRLGKFEVAYVILGVYIFIVAFVFLVFLCLNPREPRSKQEEELDKSRNISVTFKMSVIVLMSLFLCLYVGIEVAVGQLLQTFTIRQYLQLPESTGYFMTYLFWGSFALARGLSIGLAIKFSGLCLICLDLIICLVTSIFLVAGANRVEALLWVGIVTLGFGMAPIFPASIAWIEHYLPITNKTASTFILGAALGQLTIPLIINKFINQEPMVLMYVNVIVNILCFVTFIILWLLASRQGEKYKTKVNRAMYQLANFDDVEDGVEMSHANSRWQNNYNSHILMRKTTGKIT